MQLDGKVIVVTGASGALGRAVAAKVVREGAKAVLLDLREGDAPPLSSAFAVDLLNLAAVARCLDAATQQQGCIDGLVNVAGGFAMATLEKSERLDLWERLFGVNVMTCVTASRAALPHLLRRPCGRIVNVGAMGAARGTSGMGAYAASKAAVARFTESLADELKLRNITVNAVLPSIIDTPANRADMPKAAFDRWVQPEEIAAVVSFLLSDAAQAVTGALIPVTGRT